MNPFLLIALVVYAMGFSACFVVLYFNNQMSAGMGRAFGWGGRADPIWKLFLYALIWPAFLVGALRR